MPAEKCSPPFLPTAPSITSALLAVKRPRTAVVAASFQGAPFHLQQHRPALACLANNDLSVAPTYLTLATLKHTQTHSPRTTHQNILGPAPSPSHNSTSSLRPSFRRFHNQNHTHASISRSQPSSLSSSILHTSSDLHEPRQLQQHPLDQTHCRHYTPPSLQYQLQTTLPARDLLHCTATS